jgi:P-loop containing NTP hydrolase pore-1
MSCCAFPAGASEPRNLGYMVRLGLWGTGNTAFADFASFLQAISARGVAALELVAMDLKAQGVYVARTLSFAGVWPSMPPGRPPARAEASASPPPNAMRQRIIVAACASGWDTSIGPKQSVGCRCCVPSRRHGCRRRVRGEGGGAG